MPGRQSQMAAATYVKGFHDDKLTRKMRYDKLGETGLEVSALGFGSAPLGQVYDENLPQEQAIAALKKALRSGINFIDTAPWYGQGKAEASLGRALKDVPREAYYIATKVGRYDLDVKDMFDFTAERVISSVDESLKLLGLDYVDIIQVHDVEYAPSVDMIVEETLPAVEKVKEQGKARFIGITGYPIDALREVVERSTVKIDTVLSYCHLSLNDSSLLDHLAFFQERNIGVISASPLSMALLTDRGPPPWHPAPVEVKSACRGATEYCRQRGQNISSLAVKYSLSHSAIPVTLLGMESEEQVTNNLNAVIGQRTADELQVTQDILEKFFAPLAVKDWGWKDVEKYKKELSAAQNNS